MMTKNRTFVSRMLRWSFVAALLAAAGLASPASAAPVQASTTYYYSDASLTVQVGTKWINCIHPYIVIEGTVTIYKYTIPEEMC